MPSEPQEGIIYSVIKTGRKSLIICWKAKKVA